MLGRYLVEVIRPTLERSAHLVGVFGQLVHACHTRAMSAVVVEDCFNVVGLHAQFAELGCACSAEVVDAPGCDTKALVKLLLGTPPVAITAALAEQIDRWSYVEAIASRSLWLAQRAALHAG